MGPLPIQRPSGFPVTGCIEEGSGYGSLDIGKDVRGLMRYGFLGTGSREEKVGAGSKVVGNTVKIKKVESDEF